MSSQKKPVVLLVHGAWHFPLHYCSFLDALEAKGYRTLCPSLPTCEPETPADPAQADIGLIAGEAKKLVDQGEDVVAVAHSYGGVVATEAMSGLGVRERKAKGLQGGVKQLIYVTAFMLPKGATLDPLVPIESLPWARHENGMKELNTETMDIGAVFYSDVPQQERQQWLDHLGKHPEALSYYAPKSQAYEEIDTAYVYCERDAALPPAAQHALVAAIKEQGVEVRESALPAGHFPSLSMPEELADIVIQYA